MSLLSVVTVPAVAYALLLLEGVAAITVDVGTMTALQRAVPVGKLARTEGLTSSLTIAATLGGNVTGPLLVRGVGLQQALVAAAAVCMLAGVVVLVVEARRRLPAVEPELTGMLADVESLRGLPLPAREALAAAASAPDDVPAGTFLLRQGERAEEVLVLVSGECDVLARRDGGPDEVINRVSGPDLSGRSASCTSGRAPRAWRCLACIVRRISAEAFLAVVTPGAAPAALSASVEQRLVRWAG